MLDADIVVHDERNSLGLVVQKSLKRVKSKGWVCFE